MISTYKGGGFPPSYPNLPTGGKTHSVSPGSAPKGALPLEEGLVLIPPTANPPKGGNTKVRVKRGIRKRLQKPLRGG
jgi:hypothetical protein